jgi:hypothetical protein
MCDKCRRGKQLVHGGIRRSTICSTARGDKDSRKQKVRHYARKVETGTMNQDYLIASQCLTRVALTFRVARMGDGLGDSNEGA